MWWNKHIFEIDSDGNSSQVEFSSAPYYDDYTWSFSPAITLSENKRYVLRIVCSATGGADMSQNAITDITAYGKWE